MISSPDTGIALPIVAENVTFSFAEDGGNAILRDLNASFSQGSITLITGPSGCGKSTLLYLLAGLYPRNAGNLQCGVVKYGDQSAHDLTPGGLARLVGMVFQNPSLQFCMDTVENELRFSMGNACIPRDQMDATIDRVLDKCNISHLRHRLLRTLSGGEKQMVALASVLVWEPAWILLDEPFANVDDEAASRLVRMISEIHRDGVGILVVDHRLDHWMDVADVCLQWDSGSRLIPVPRHEWQARQTDRENEWRRIAQWTLANREISASQDSALRIDNLVVEREGRVILGPMNRTFESGKVYAIIGTSGSGKSTLFDVLLGAVPFSGSIIMGGQNLHKRGAPQPGAIGFVMQQPQDQFVADTVSEEVAVGLHWQEEHLPTANLIESILAPIGLWEHRGQSPYMLSQGQQRRLGVAALLPYECRVLVCDEPTYAQDDARAAAIVKELLHVVAQQGTTMIFSTHDRSLAAGIADVVLELRDGCLHEID